MANRVTTIFEVVTDKATGTLNTLRTAVGQADTSIGKLKAGWGSLVESFKASQGAQLAAAGAVGLVAQKSIEANSALEESINAVKVAYKASADEVLALGENSAESVGMSQRAFNELAVQFSSFAQKISAQTGQPVAAVLDDLTKRVADFASVMNLDANEAAQVFMSTLSGETEPIRRFGKDVSAAAVEQYALANGLIKTKSELTETIKVQARYGLLMQQTKDTAGDFANTSESLANQQRILAAQVEDLAAAFGGKLVPVVADTAKIVTDLISTYENLKGVSGEAGNSLVQSGVKAAQGGKGLSALTQGLDDLGKITDWVKDKTTAHTEAINDGVDSLANYRNAANQYADDLNTRYSTAHAAGTEATEASRLAAEAYAEQLEETGQAVIDQAEAEAEAREEAERNLEAVESLTDAYNEQKRSTDQLRSAKLQLIGGEIGVREAQRQARTAAKELGDEIGNLTVGTDEYQGAVDDAAEAQLNAAQAAADYRAEQMEANGSTVDATTRARLMKEELYTLAGTLEGPLRDAILGFISDLDKIPSSKTVQISVTSGGGKVNTGGGLAIGGGIISGGPDTGPRQSFGQSFGQPVQGGITMNFTVAPGTDQTAFGKEVMKALRALKRAGGDVSF